MKNRHFLYGLLLLAGAVCLTQGQGNTAARRSRPEAASARASDADSKRKESIANCVSDVQKNDPEGMYGRNKTLALGFCTFAQGWNDRLRKPFKPTAAQAKWFKSLGRLRAEKGGNLPAVEGANRIRWAQLKSAGPVQRREYRTLSTVERNAYHQAIQDMKTNMVGSVSKYDILVGFHQSASFPNPPRPQHGGPAFLPWHREFLFRYEKALQEQDSTVSLPYWDSTLDRPLPTPEHSSLWHPHFMGNGNGVVNSGPFNGFTVIPACTFLGASLTRNVGVISWGDLFEDADVNFVLGKTQYQQIVVTNSYRFEGDHGAVHGWVGGHMANSQCSPADPVFWMHHAFIDCVWEDFRQNHQTTNIETEYPVGVGPASHGPFETMHPFGPLVNRDGLSNHYTNNHYTCAPRPDACTAQTDCVNTANLWCDTSVNQCKAKIKPWGDCTGVPAAHRYHACYRPAMFVSYRCIFNKCRPIWKFQHHVALQVASPVG